MIVDPVCGWFQQGREHGEEAGGRVCERTVFGEPAAPRCGVCAGADVRRAREEPPVSTGSVRQGGGESAGVLQEEQECDERVRAQPAAERGCAAVEHKGHAEPAGGVQGGNGSAERAFFGAKAASACGSCVQGMPGGGGATEGVDEAVPGSGNGVGVGCVVVRGSCGEGVVVCDGWCSVCDETRW